jgi:hypothetical protein
MFTGVESIVKHWLTSYNTPPFKGNVFQKLFWFGKALPLRLHKFLPLFIQAPPPSFIGLQSCEAFRGIPYSITQTSQLCVGTCNNND